MIFEFLLASGDRFNGIYEDDGSLYLTTREGRTFKSCCPIEHIDFVEVTNGES